MTWPWALVTVVGLFCGTVVAVIAMMIRDERAEREGRRK